MAGRRSGDALLGLGDGAGADASATGCAPLRDISAILAGSNLVRSIRMEGAFKFNLAGFTAPQIMGSVRTSISAEGTVIWTPPVGPLASTLCKRIMKP